MLLWSNLKQQDEVFFSCGLWCSDADVGIVDVTVVCCVQLTPGILHVTVV